MEKAGLSVGYMCISSNVFNAVFFLRAEMDGESGT